MSMFGPHNINHFSETSGRFSCVMVKGYTPSLIKAAIAAADVSIITTLAIPLECD